MMNRQLELRKQETSTLQAYVSLVIVLSIDCDRKCDALEAKLLQLRAAAKTVSLVKVTDVMSVVRCYCRPWDLDQLTGPVRISSHRSKRRSIKLTTMMF